MGKRTYSFVFAALAAMVLSTPALTQEQAPPQQDQQPEVGENEIVVTGFSKQYKLTGKQLARAQKAFTDKRNKYAPQSQLYFLVRPANGGDISDLDIYLERGDEIISLPLDDQSRFVLPPLGGKDWTLYANRNRSGIEVLPTILSPGTSDSNRLLGDLRLQCEVSWAMIGPKTSIVVRAMFSAAGGCHSSKFGYYIRTDTAIASGHVSNGSVTIPLRLWGDHSYQAPVGEKTMPNSARVKLDPA